MKDAVETLIIAASVLSVLLSPAACTMHRHYRIEQAIAHGADPIDAKCAIEMDIGNSPLCIARAVSRAGESSK